MEQMICRKSTCPSIVRFRVVFLGIAFIVALALLLCLSIRNGLMGIVVITTPLKVWKDLWMERSEEFIAID